MAKRKSRKAKAPPKKKPAKLDTAFVCPFCGHPDAVGCLIDLKHMFARASCRICQESYATSANALTEPVDRRLQRVDRRLRDRQRGRRRQPAPPPPELRR